MKCYIVLYIYVDGFFKYGWVVAGLWEMRYFRARRVERFRAWGCYGSWFFFFVRNYLWGAEGLRSFGFRVGII